jgi:glycosyltransferase involved in cell wall biosynthesis
LTFLWIIDLAYSRRNHHGALLRYLNLSKELTVQGHSVVFAVYMEDNREQALEWLESLRAEGMFKEFCELHAEPAASQWNRSASLLLPFGLHRLMIRPFIASVANSISATVATYSPDIVIVSSRYCLFEGHQFSGRPRIADFCDSMTLHRWREFRHAAAHFDLRGALQALHSCYYFLFQEIYSSRRYNATMVVSPVDKKVLDWNGKRDRNVCIGNGVEASVNAVTTKKSRQIVFSGAMNFPPNFEGAIWFLDHVFPLVLETYPDVTMVIAGALPDPGLLARASKNVIVTGFVPDLRKVLAESALYVAPLVSGSGFKNKIVEAIASGTYVIGTTYAVEFLEPDVRELIVAEDDPKELARAICEFLANPEASDDKLRQLEEIVRVRFTWSAKALELATLADSLRANTV